MTVASCPACKEKVMVPVDATPESKVRCPLCQHEFTLQTVLTQLPPSLIVLESPSAAEQPPYITDSMTGVSPPLDSDVSVAVAAPQRPDSDESVPAFDFIAESERGGDGETTISPVRRPTRPQKNPTIEAMKIIAGGLLAIPAAQIILWWFVPVMMRRDLLGIGPQVSRVVPWVVPAQFRAPQQDESAARPDESAGRVHVETLQSRRSKTRDSNGSARQAQGSRAENTTFPTVGGETNKGSATQVDLGSLAPSSPSSQDVPSDVAPKPARKKIVRKRQSSVRGAPEFDSSALRTALVNAVQARIAWDTNLDPSDEHRAQLSQQFYQAFAQLSEVVTYPPPHNDETLNLFEACSEILKTFAEQPKILAMIGNQGAAWLEQPGRSCQGVILFGTVTATRANGKLFETALELGSREERAVTVVSRIDPQETFTVGDRILMLGAIVENPRETLQGYQGQEPLVVMGGFPVVLE